MPEISLNVGMFVVLKVRLNPTEVRGEGSAFRPVLHLPFKLQVQDAGPVNHPLRYTLLWLAGTLVAKGNEHFGEFTAGPLAEESNAAIYDRPCGVNVILTDSQVRRFEDLRSGGGRGAFN